MNHTPQWYRTDEYEEAVSSLEAAERFVREVRDDPSWWKWVIISTHCAVQGFMVLHLRGSHSFAPLTDKSAAACIEAHRSGKPPPNERLDNFPKLYKKVKGDFPLGLVTTKHFVPGSDTDRCMKKLNELRNELIHFTPKGWSLEIAGLPNICLEAINVVEFLFEHGGNIAFYNQEHADRTRSALRVMKEELKAAHNQAMQS